jgi:divalent metal cation (Fe/Co/Zn/Cd) transporter
VSCGDACDQERHGAALAGSSESALIVVRRRHRAPPAFIALAAIIATLLTGDPVWDALGTILIGATACGRFFVAVEVKALLIGQSVDPRVLSQMREFIENQPQVKRIFNLITLQFGPDVIVAVKAEMEQQTSDRELVRVINLTEAALRARFPAIRWLFFEPDDRD